MHAKANVKTNPASGEVIAGLESTVAGAPVDVQVLLTNFANNDVAFGIAVYDGSTQVFYFPWVLARNSSACVPFHARAFIGGSGIRVEVSVEAAVTGKVAAAVLAVPSV